VTWKRTSRATAIPVYSLWFRAVGALIFLQAARRSCKPKGRVGVSPLFILKGRFHAVCKMSVRDLEKSAKAWVSWSWHEACSPRRQQRYSRRWRRTAHDGLAVSACGRRLFRRGDRLRRRLREALGRCFLNTGWVASSRSGSSSTFSTSYSTPIVFEEFP
jgi:hypothetical protein